jgi:hypothetical protein
MVTILTEEGSVALWELSSRRVRHVFRDFCDAFPAYESAVFDPTGAWLAVRADVGPVQIWDVRGRSAGYPDQLPAATLHRLWRQLQADDAPAAFEALRRLAAAPAVTVPFVEEQLAQQPLCEGPQLQSWLNDLAAPAFGIREAAMRELRGHADTQVTELTTALAAATLPEVRHRLETILASRYLGSQTYVQRERLIELLEWCGTPAAKTLLQKWAHGPKLSLRAQAAKQALTRLGN